VKNAKRKVLKQVLVPKDKIILLTHVLNLDKKTPIIKPGQWTLTIHNGERVYISKVEKEKKNLKRV